MREERSRKGEEGHKETGESRRVSVAVNHDFDKHAASKEDRRSIKK